MRWSSPFFQDGRNLGDRQYPGINRSDDQIMSCRIRKLGFLIRPNPFILLTTQIGESSYRRVDNSWQVTFTELLPARSR